MVSLVLEIVSCNVCGILDWNDEWVFFEKGRVRDKDVVVFYKEIIDEWDWGRLLGERVSIKEESFGNIYLIYVKVGKGVRE